MKPPRCLNPPLAPGPDPLHSQSEHAQTRSYSFNSSPVISDEALLANHRARSPHSGLLFLGFFSLFILFSLFFLSLSVAFFLFFPFFPSSSSICFPPNCHEHRPPRPLFFFFFFSRSLLRPIDHRFTRLAGIRSFYSPIAKRKQSKKPISSSLRLLCFYIRRHEGCIFGHRGRHRRYGHC